MLRLHFVIETAQTQLKGTEHMVLVGAKAPFAFFAYPGKPSVLTPEGCETTTLCPVDGDPIASLEAMAAELGALNEKPLGIAQPNRPERPTGKFTLEGLGQALGATMPEGAIVVAIRATGRGFFSAGAPRLVEQHGRLDRLGG
jgi:acetolactate synthase-1/2/3 large subunit